MKAKTVLTRNTSTGWMMCEKTNLYDAVTEFRPLFGTLERTKSACLSRYLGLAGLDKIDPGYEMRFFRLTAEFQPRTRTKEQQDAYESRKKGQGIKE